MAKGAVAEKTTQKPKSSHGSQRGFGAKTILFNDNFHTFEEVASQLVKATKCTYSQGLKFAWEVHTTGSAVVYTGHLERCEAVAMVLEEIKLKTKVEL